MARFSKSQAHSLDAGMDSALRRRAEAAEHLAAGARQDKAGGEARLAAADSMMAGLRAAEGLRRGRGAALNPKGRFERLALMPSPAEAESAPKLRTEVQEEKPRRIISRNDTPDIPFAQSINPYRGCEHGCIYCYARPSHAYMGLSAGLDFESRLFAKPQAAALLRRELAAPNYRVRLIALGSNTDPYQPIEKQYCITRALLETLYAARHPVSIVTKSALILRDSDILAAMAAENLVHVSFSVESLDKALLRRLDPRAATAERRLGAMAALAALSVPVSVLIAPLIPAVNEYEVEAIMAAAAKAGAKNADYTVLRLPYEVAPLFKDWLLRNFPHKYNKVLAQLRLLRGGAEQEAEERSFLHGRGPMADLLARRFRMAAAKCGMNTEPIRLDCGRFAVPRGWRQELPPAPKKQRMGQQELF